MHVYSVSVTMLQQFFFFNRGILKWNPDNREEKYYLKYVLAVRSLRDKIVGPTDDIVEVHDCVVYIVYWKGVL